MTKFKDPRQLIQAHLVFGHLLLDIEHGDHEALKSFCNDKASPVRKLVAAAFTKEKSPIVVEEVDLPLFRPMAMGDFPAVVSFSSTEHFSKENAIGLKLILGPNFLANFMGMVEGNVPVCDIATAMLMKKATSADIRKELGDNYEMFLVHLYHAIANHGTGNKWNGFLLANGEQNIFFIRDKRGMLWSVYTRLLEGGVWDIEAFPLMDQTPWSPDSQVIFKR